jgi:cytosine deaminase
MCSGAILLFGISRVVVGENKTFMGAEDHLRAQGVEVIVKQDEECVRLMTKFIKENAELWEEDSGQSKE